MKYWGGASDVNWDGTMSLPAVIKRPERAAFFAAHSERMEKLRRHYSEDQLHISLFKGLKVLRKDIKAGQLTSVSTNTAAGRDRNNLGRYVKGKSVRRSHTQPATCRRAGAVGRPTAHCGRRSTACHRPLFMTLGGGAGQA